jgi:hypothetical protein
MLILFPSNGCVKFGRKSKFGRVIQQRHGRGNPLGHGMVLAELDGVTARWCGAVVHALVAQTLGWHDALGRQRKGVLDWAERSGSVGQAVAGPHKKKRGARAGWAARRVWV